MKQNFPVDALAEQMRVLSEMSPALMGVGDSEGRYVWINRVWTQLLGYSIEDLSDIHYTSLIHPDDRSMAARPQPGPDPVSVELRHSRKDGSYVWLDWSVFGPQDRTEIYTVGYDITVRKEMEIRLASVERNFSDLVENAGDVICTGDLDGNLISINKAAERISGYSATEVVGVPLSQFVAPEYRQTLKQMMDLKLAGRKSTVYDIELLTKDGRRIPLELNTSLIYADGKPVGIKGIGRDTRVRNKIADELRQRNEELERANSMVRSLMNQDSLTKLPNRRSLEDALERTISFARRSKQPMCLILCDLDRFKNVNDNFGHSAGDEVLSAFGALLGSSCRLEDTASRYGGEEFVLLLPNTALDAALEFSERLRMRTESLRVPSGATVTASFGVTQFKPEDSSDSLMSRADAALYLAKEGGRNRVCSY